MSNLRTRTISKIKLSGIKVLSMLLTVPRPLVLVNAGSSLHLCRLLAQQSKKKVFFVTDKTLYQLGIIQPLVDELTRHNVASAIYTEVTPEPTTSVAQKGLDHFYACGADCIVAVGGGSVIDVAKVIALAATNNKRPEELVGILKGRKAPLPLYAIPTTAGTGSEVTIGAVISDNQTHQKGIVVDNRIVPQIVALDAKVMQGVPPVITADTGMDALTHALEAWMSLSATPETDDFAAAAVNLIFSSLVKAYQQGDDLAARESMALAAHYAGLALNKAGLGYVHAIAHQLGAFYALPHGRANTIVLPHIMAFNRKACLSRLAELSRRVHLSDAASSDAAAADRLIEHVRQLINDLHIDLHVPNIKTVDFSDIIQHAFDEAHGFYNVPRYMTVNKAQQILQQIAAIQRVS